MVLARSGLDDGAISTTSGGARHPVDGILRADPLADDSISALAQPSERRSRRVRQPSRCFGQDWDGRAIGPLQQVDRQRQLAARSGRKLLSLFAHVVRITDNGRLGERPRLRRLDWLDHLFRRFVNSDCVQTASGQFERVALSGVGALRTRTRKGIPLAGAPL